MCIYYLLEKIILSINTTKNRMNIGMYKINIFNIPMYITGK